MVINKEQVVLRVQGSPALSAEQLIQLFKSESGARIRVLFPEFKECASEGGFWNDDYIVDSVENKDCDLPQGRVLEYTECDESSEVH
jgi:REP element-mobilizing transposase RayT